MKRWMNLNDHKPWDRPKKDPNRKIHPSEYYSSDIWKRDVPPVTDFKRGSTYNKVGMWIMWTYYIIIILMVTRLILVLNS